MVGLTTPFFARQGTLSDRHGGSAVDYTVNPRIGLPFITVSTTAPLLQKWFSETGHPSAKDPYFLYAASNFGSLLALIGYPFVVEPNLKLVEQAWVWAIGFAVLVAMIPTSPRQVFVAALVRGACPGWCTHADDLSADPELEVQ